MKRNLLSNFKSLLFRRTGRQATVFDDDVFIVSYPKSGNTFLRFLVGRLINPHVRITFSNIGYYIPDIHYFPDIYKYASKQNINLNRGRILKSHECFDPRYKNLIYLIRDPRDVAVSYWYHYLNVKLIDESYSKDIFYKKYIEGGLDMYGSWMENVGSWLGAREDTSGFLLIRYEDLLADPTAEAIKICNHLQIQSSTSLIENAVKNSSFEEMQNLERTASITWKPLKRTRKDIPFVRKGRSGQWKNELPSTISNEIEQKWYRLLKKLNYLDN